MLSEKSKKAAREIGKNLAEKRDKIIIEVLLGITKNDDKIIK